MILPKKAIEEFKQLYFEDYGVMLSDLEATEKAYHLFNGLKTIITKDTLDRNLEKVQI